MKGPSVLIANNKRSRAQPLKAELETAGYRVRTVSRGETALHQLQVGEYDLVLLDIVLPDAEGFEVLRRLRETSQVPVIVLIDRGGEPDRVRGLELGADDSLARPFGTPELLARVKAVLRRARLPASARLGPPLVCGEITIDFGQQRVLVRGQEIHLSPTEYRLLCELAHHPGQVLLREQLLSRVWGRSYRNQIEYLWVYIGYLREKIERNPREPEYILTMPGIGYMFRRPG